MYPRVRRLGRRTTRCCEPAVHVAGRRWLSFFRSAAFAFDGVFDLLDGCEYVAMCFGVFRVVCPAASYLPDDSDLFIGQTDSYPVVDWFVCYLFHIFI